MPELTPNGQPPAPVNQDLIRSLTSGGPASADAPVAIVGGKALSMADILKLQQDAASGLAAKTELEAKLAELEADRKLLFSKQAPETPEAVDRLKLATRKALASAGYSAQEIDEEIDRTFGEPQVEDTPQPETRRGPQISENPQRDPTAHLTAQVVKQFFSTAIDQGIDGNKDLTKFFEYAKGKRGPEVATRQREEWKGQIEQEMRAMISERLKLAGSRNLELSWFNEFNGKAAQKVADKVKMYLGDPNELGKASGADGGSNPFVDYLGRTRQPVTAPKYREGMEGGELDKQVAERMTDRFVRAIAETNDVTVV